MRRSRCSVLTADQFRALSVTEIHSTNLDDFVINLD
jgi:hypothetical protein